MATKTGGFSIVISAVDKATAPINAINKSLAGMRAPFERVGKSLHKFGDLSGVSALGRGLAGIGSTAVKAAASITKIATPLAALTSLGGIAGVVAMTEAWARFGQNLRYNAIRAGVGVSSLQALSGAVEMAGGSAESGAAAMVNLKDVLYDMKGGRNNEALLYLRDLKIATDGVMTGSETAATMFPKLANALGKVKDATARTRIETVFFGAAADDMDKLIQRGGATLQEYLDTMQKHGLMTEWSTHLSDQAALSWVNLKQSVGGLTNSLAEHLSPALTKVLGFFSDLIDRNRTKIVDTIGEAFGRLVVWLEKVDWQNVAKYIGDMAGRLLDAAKAVGDIQLPEWARHAIGLPPSEEQNRADALKSADRQDRELELAGRVDTARHIVDRLVSDGETRPNAVGIVAGLNRESGLDPQAHAIDTDGLMHRGLASWSPDRNQDFYKWKGKNLKDATLDEQIDFIHHELVGTERTAGDRLRQQTTARDSAESFTEEYLRPANKVKIGRHDGIDADRFDKLMGPQTTARDSAESFTEEYLRPANKVKIGRHDGIDADRFDKLMGPQTTARGGDVKVDVHIHNAPPGMTATATSSGAAAPSPPKVYQAGVGR